MGTLFIPPGYFGPAVYIPTVAEVADGVTFGVDNALTGTYTGGGGGYTAAGNVRDGVDRGDGVLGTLELPAEADVRLGTDYGANGTEFEGELDPGAGTTVRNITITQRGISMHDR